MIQLKLARCLFVLCASMAATVVIPFPSSAAATEPSPAALKERSLYHSKALWETQDGKKSTLISLRGTPVVVAMLYTSCPASCPLTMSDLTAIEKGLSERAKSQVKFAVFSFDSDRDKPKKLKYFAEKFKVDMSRWTFFHGKKESVRELSALLGIRFKVLEGGDFDHSNIISMLDTEGLIIHQQNGVRQNPLESIRSLEAALHLSP